MTECKYRCKDCNHRFSVKVHGSDANCPKKGDYLRNCPKCESRNVTAIGGNNSVLCIVISAIIGLIGGFLYIFLKSVDWRI
ncbi:MAG: zinc ribbon domain-containing protein [Candidatus Lokiarchaeota archaeon]|nr:zinc ribbon domain-containing protein [Candidatus Lokiarchaeota archaeon]